MNVLQRLFLTALSIITVYSSGAAAFDFQIYKQVTLPSFPHITVPIYKSAGNHGPAILFVHGNSSSSRAFVKQKLSLLGLTHRLFFMDLPGFGRAGKVDPSLSFPVDANGLPVGFPEYQVGMIEAIARVANDPGIQAKVVIGWSLGGDLVLLTQGLGLLPNAKGIMMFGTAPTGAGAPAVPPFLGPNVPGLPFDLSILASFGFAFNLDGTPPLGFSFLGQFTDPVPAYAPAPIANAPNTGSAYLRAFFNNYRRLHGPIPDFIKEDGFVRADARARGSLGVVSFGLLPPGPIALPNELDVLKGLQGQVANPNDDIPIAVLHGEEDAFVNYNYLQALKQQGFLPTLWKNKIIKVENSGHAVQYDGPIRFNLLLKEFIDDL